MQLLKLAISDINILPDRQRKDLGDDEKKAGEEFEKLKASISANGLLQPPGVDKDNNLLYGFRRLKAAEALGWTHISVVVDPEKTLTTLERESIELDENLQRFDLSWQERERALARLNKIKQELDPTWTQRKTAIQAGVNQSAVSEAELLAKFMDAFPEVKNAGTRKQALSIAKNKAKTTLRKVEIVSNPVKYQEVSEKVVRGKAEEVILTLPDGFTKHIVTDGPFGINYDKRPAAEGVHEAYEDSPESYRERTSTMAPHMYRVLASDGFLIWFLGHDHLDWTRDLFRSVGFAVDPIPLMWNRSDGRCYTARPDRWFGKGYDIALHCIKGDPQMVDRSRDQGKHGKGNVFTYPPVPTKDKEHIVERPVEMYADIVRSISLQGEKITDFFGGSGAIAAAAASLGRDHFTVEMNPNHVATIVAKIYAHTPQPSKPQLVTSNGTEQS